MSPGPPQPHIRASDEERERAAERLNKAAVEGRLDPDELDERLAAVYSARWTSELARLTADVTPPAQHPAPLPPAIAYPPAAAPIKPTNGLAIASIVAGFFWFLWLGSIAAVILGHAALRQIKESEGREDGRALAITGLVLGYGALAALAAWIALVVAL